jgi:hypothetical protein
MTTLTSKLKILVQALIRKKLKNYSKVSNVEKQSRFSKSPDWVLAWKSAADL